MAPVIDLHGLTQEDALAEVDRTLNHAFIQETEDRRLCFITGRGGVLQSGIQELLTNHPLVKEIRVEGPSLKILLEDL